MDLLRFSTAGSVDDGKSTLIGRLLFDSKAIPDDQYEAIRRASDTDDVDLALLTDGLRAEREQKITIDVAYRYFATARRRFIIADTPGHAQYTRNMVTGASTAQAAVILVDARKGLLEQSRRHATLSALLRVPHLIVAINKMDLVGFDEAVYRAIEADFADFAQKLGVVATTIPLSALAGDNVVFRSERTPYYSGPSLLEHLETIPIQTTDGPFRLPVQCVIRPHQNFRGFAGRLAGGTLRPGDTVVALPSGKQTRVTEVVSPDGPLAQASAGDSVVVALAEELDISRGDLLAHPETAPTVARRLTATLCVLSDTGLVPGRPYIALHTSRQVSAQVEALHYRLSVETLEHEPARRLELNELGSATLTLAQPLFLDRYAQNRELGGFLLVDPATNLPIAAGMVDTILSESTASRDTPLTRTERELLHGHRGGIVRVANRQSAASVELALRARGWRTAFLESPVAAPTFVENGYIAVVLAEDAPALEPQLAALELSENDPLGLAEGI